MTVNEVLRGRRVLIVEDEPLIILMMEDILSDLGCHVAGVATSRKAALLALESRPAPDVVVLDLNLDGQRSDEVASAVVARGIPFLIVTGYGDDALTEARCHGPILRKPFREGDLARALAAALGAAKPAPGDTHERAMTHAR